MNYNELIKGCFSIMDVCKVMGIQTNGSGYKKAKLIISENSLDISHFDNGLSKKIKIERVEKRCPVCGISFTTKKNSKEKTTCSISCSNTKFRTGENHGSWKDISEYDSRSNQFRLKYRKICFEYHEHKCVVCDERKMLDVHHFDENKFNNNPENLIPICATHHNYLHSIYREEVIDKVISYRDEFINKNVLNPTLGGY